MFPNKKLHFIVQLPPPVHGSSLMNSILTDAILKDRAYQTKISEIQIAKSNNGLGNFSLKKLFTTFLVIFKTIKDSFTFKPDIAYVTMSPLGFAFFKDAFIIFFVKIFSKRTLIHLHGKGINDEIPSKIKRFIYKKTFKNTEVILLSKLLEYDIKEVHQGIIHILPNGIPKVDLQVKNKSFKKEFLYLSNLVKTKGIEVLLKAAKEVVLFEPEFKLTIVGDQVDYSVKELKSFISEHRLENNITFKGPAYGKEKYDVLQESCFFILPTFYRNECLPISIIEAMQTENIIISTNIGAISDLVQPAVNGYLVEPNSVTSLKDAILKCCQLEQNNYIQMAKENVVKYNKYFTDQHFITNFKSILNYYE